MLGRYHILLTAFTIAAIVSPIAPTYPIFTGLLIFGALIGSVLPDSDSKNATVFKTDVDGFSADVQKYFGAVSIFFPLFGYTTKYLIHKPSVLIYNLVLPHTVEEKHRGLMHSILGVLTTTVLLTVYLSGITYGIQLYTGEQLINQSLPYVVVFVGGIGIGEFLHMLEDSCTKTGIKWNYPFHTWKIKGRITTTGDSSDTWTQSAFTGLLLIVTVVGGYGGLYMQTTPVVPVHVVTGVGVMLLWGVYGFVVAKWRVSS